MTARNPLLQSRKHGAAQTLFSFVLSSLVSCRRSVIRPSCLRIARTQDTLHFDAIIIHASDPRPSCAQGRTLALPEPLRHSLGAFARPCFCDHLAGCRRGSNSLLTTNFGVTSILDLRVYSYQVCFLNLESPVQCGWISVLCLDLITVTAISVFWRVFV